MKAPDKIWANDYGLWWRNKQPVKYTEEYIRKEALLEWLQEARAIPHDGALIRDRAFQEVINYINEM